MKLVILVVDDASYGPDLSFDIGARLGGLDTTLVMLPQFYLPSMDFIDPRMFWPQTDM